MRGETKQIGKLSHGTRGNRRGWTSRALDFRGVDRDMGQPELAYGPGEEIGSQLARLDQLDRILAEQRDNQARETGTAAYIEPRSVSWSER